MLFTCHHEPRHIANHFVVWNRPNEMESGTHRLCNWPQSIFYSATPQESHLNANLTSFFPSICCSISHSLCDDDKQKSGFKIHFVFSCVTSCLSVFFCIDFWFQNHRPIVNNRRRICPTMMLIKQSSIRIASVYIKISAQLVQPSNNIKTNRDT